MCPFLPAQRIGSLEFAFNLLILKDVLEEIQPVRPQSPRDFKQLVFFSNERRASEASSTLGCLLCVYCF